MNRTMITATNTLSQLQKQLDHIGHNLANINTTGYKRRDNQFSELLAQQFQNQPQTPENMAAQVPMGIRQGVGASLGKNTLNFSLGSIQKTDRALDIALTKEGQFLQLSVDGATRFTRNGVMYLSPLANGSNFVSLVNGDGYPVLDVDGDPIVFTDQHKELKISENGRLSIIGNNDQSIQEFDLGIVQVNKTQLLEAQGNNLYGLPNLAALGLNQEDVFEVLDGEARNRIGVMQGALEQANVELATEMADLMLTQRSYQFNARSISLADQMMGLVNGIR